jgi:hypothetical protein
LISTELQNFYQRWLLKAEEYHSNDLQDCFDKFFTLYVAYNRLYSELAIILAKKERGIIRGNYISDSQVAKNVVQTYVGSDRILQSLENDVDCVESITSIIYLIEHKVFKIKLDRLSGQQKFNRNRVCNLPEKHRVEADSILLEGLKSETAYRKVYAILDLIYSIRCNIFHGQKGYNEVQIKILIPVTKLLKKIMSLLYEKMSQDYDC